MVTQIGKIATTLSLREYEELKLTTMSKEDILEAKSKAKFVEGEVFYHVTSNCRDTI